MALRSFKEKPTGKASKAAPEGSNKASGPFGFLSARVRAAFAPQVPTFALAFDLEDGRACVVNMHTEEIVAHCETHAHARAICVALNSVRW